MEFVLIGLVCAACFVFGWRARELHAMHTINSLIESAEQKTSIKVKVEKQNDTFYVYKEDGTFMAQGKDMDDLDAALRKRFPDTRFLIQEDNLKELGLYNESL